ncbi:MAG TPA: DUF3037 domain-containing protein [Gammaproteobacteria bacterium]|nr:DUF3037 domain-containing protein [Gammaproteobacteria bacterium]
MHDLATYDYAIVRVVPKVERAEFVNAGVIVSCPARDLLLARIELDEQRLVALDPTIDLESVRRHLAAIPIICAGGEHAGPIGRLSQRERFHWLVAPRSTIIQTSPTHTGSARDLEAVVERLLETMVRARAAAS